MANKSAGALFLQVKLDTSSAESQLKRLGREFTQAVSPKGTTTAATAAVVANARIAQQALKSQAVQAKAAGQQQVAQANVQIAQTKARAAAEAEAGRQSRANARAATVAAAQRARAEKDALAAQKEGQRVLARFRAPVLAQQARDRARYERETARAMKEQAREAQRIAESRRLSNIGRITGSGASELFTGLGAARSGNYAYGAAAGLRYFTNLRAAAAASSLAIGATAAAIATVAITSVAATGAVAALSKALIDAGTKGAESFEMLRIQLSGLLGSTARGQQEFDFLLALGRESIVPTQALIEADRTLLAFGVTIDSTRRQLVTFISDFGSAVGATQDQIYFLSLAVSQVVAKGKADSVDLRQIANAGVNTAALLTTIGEQTGRTYQQVVADVSEGKVTADQLLSGLIAYGEQFASTADAARQSTQGLKQNIVDTFQTFLSNAFLTERVLSPIQEFLRGIATSLNGSEDLFDNLARASRNLFDSILGGNTAEQAAGFLQTLFRDVIPAAVNATAEAIRQLRPIAEGVFQAVRFAVQTVSETFAALPGSARLLALQVFGILKAVQLSIVQFAALGIMGAAAFGLLVNGAKAFYFALTGNFDAAFESIRTGLVNIFAAGLRVQAMFAGLNAAAQQFSGPSSSDLNTDEENRARARDNALIPQGGATPSVAAVAPDTAALEAAAQKIGTARNEIYEMLRRYFGQPSEALAGLFGDKGKFEASVDSIVSTAKRLYDAVLEAAPGRRGRGIAAAIAEQTKELIALAEEREGIVERLDAAEQELKNKVKERQDFARQIRDAAFNFVNSLNVGTQTTFKQLDGSGSFAQTTAPESYSAAVKRRLEEYKAFVKNIRRLQKLNLDKSLIKSFLEAGPDAAGAVVAQIAGSGAGVVAELNAAQADLRKLAREFGVEQGGLFYNAGVQQAQSTVDGLESQRLEVERAARRLANRIINQVRPLAKKMRDQGSAAGGAAAEALTSSFNSTLGDLELANPFEGIFGDDDEITRQAGIAADAMLSAGKSIGRNLVDGIFEGFKTKIETFVTQVALWLDDHIVQPIKDFFGIESPAKKMMPIGEDIIAGVWEGMKTFLGGLPAKITRGVFDYITAPVRLALKGVSFILPVPSASTLLAQVRTAFTSVITWLGGLGERFRTAAGDVWGWLVSAFPSARTLTDKLSGLSSAFRGIVELMRFYWNKLDLSFKIVAPDWLRFLPPPINQLAGKKWEVTDLFPDIPALAAGGYVSRPTLAMVGDTPGASEAIVPLNARGVSSFLSDLDLGGDTLVKVYLGDEELRGMVRTEVVKLDRTAAGAVKAGRR